MAIWTDCETFYMSSNLDFSLCSLIVIASLYWPARSEFEYSKGFSFYEQNFILKSLIHIFKEYNNLDFYVKIFYRRGGPINIFSIKHSTIATVVIEWCPVKLLIARCTLKYVVTTKSNPQGTVQVVAKQLTKQWSESSGKTPHNNCFHNTNMIIAPSTIHKRQLFENRMETCVSGAKYLCCQNCFSDNKAKDFSQHEKSRSCNCIWLPILVGVFASVGSVAVVLFFINLKDR